MDAETERKAREKGKKKEGKCVIFFFFFFEVFVFFQKLDCKS